MPSIPTQPYPISRRKVTNSNSSPINHRKRSHNTPTMIIPISKRSIFDRASAGTAGSGIAAGGLAAKNSGGSDQSTKFIIGFCVAIPCTLIIVGLYFFFRWRKNKKAGKSGNNKNAKPKNNAWGKRNNEGGFLGKLSGTLRPTELPAAFKREKELLPSSL